MLVFEVDRSEEFSPLKNKDGEIDSPVSCRNLLSNLHRKWILQAGGSFTSGSDGLCEVSPLVSYAGEGLEDRVKGKNLQLPLNLEVERSFEGEQGVQ